MKFFSPRFPSVPHGFSLVEITLALGIVSLSLVSLIGLLPAGLGVLRESMDQTVHAAIVQRVASGLTLAEFEKLESDTLYFDQEGQLLDTSTDPEARYKVTILKGNPSLPGYAEDDQNLGKQLTRLRIGISRADISDSPTVWHAVQIAAVQVAAQ
jgi:uncharacterized protein (TIGR02598 family)